MIPKDKWGVHERHCCPKHGCKYGDMDCPVTLGLTTKHNEHCEMCEDETDHPDPLSLLEAWLNANSKLYRCNERAFANRREIYEQGKSAGVAIFCEQDLSNILKNLRKNPTAVAERGKKEGWWK